MGKLSKMSKEKVKYQTYSDKTMQFRYFFRIDLGLNFLSPFKHVLFLYFSCLFLFLFISTLPFLNYIMFPISIMVHISYIYIPLKAMDYCITSILISQAIPTTAKFLVSFLLVFHYFLYEFTNSLNT